MLDNKRLIKYIIIALITLPEIFYFSTSVFGMQTEFKLSITIIVLAVLSYITYQSSKSLRIRLLTIFGLLILSGLIIGLNIGTTLSYLNQFAIHFVNGNELKHSANLVYLGFVTMLNYYVNLLIINGFKSYYVQLVKTLAFIIAIWNFYQTQGFFSSFVLAVLILFILLEAVSSFFSKLTRSKDMSYQLFRVVRILLLVSFFIALLASVSKDPLGFLDELEWFEDESSRFEPRIDDQSEIHNQPSVYNYNNSTMFVVRTPHLSKLRGNIFTTYSSDGWTIPERLNQEVMDYEQEYLSKIEILDNYNVSYTPYELEVLHRVQSQLLYSPADGYVVTDIETESNNSFFYVSDTDLLEGTEYTVNALDIEFSTVAFVDMMKSLNVDTSDEAYLQLPEDFNEEVRNLALQITEGKETDYEKVVAIEKYLADNFEYDTSPLAKPDYYDYVDFFLFESNEGFCTHYASSMVLMLRSIGIPARYVVGYVMDTEGFVEFGENETNINDLPQDEVATYHINRDKSHTWVEVKFEEYGWLEFEPTQPYFNRLEVGAPVETEPEEPTTETPTIPEVESNPTYYWYFLFVIPVGVGTYYFIKRRQISNEEKVVRVWKKLRKRIIKDKILKTTNETARELLKLARLDEEIFTEALEIYEEACYSKNKTSEETLLRMKELYKLY